MAQHQNAQASEYFLQSPRAQFSLGLIALLRLRLVFSVRRPFWSDSTNFAGTFFFPSSRVEPKLNIKGTY